MVDQDWLERGHGGGESLQPLIKSSSDRAADRVSVRAVLRGAPAAVKRPPRRRTKALVGWLLYCATAVGGTAAAFSVRDTLFPSLGAPTPAAVWDNTRVPGENSTNETTTSPSGSGAVSGALLPETDPSATASSVDDQTVPSVSQQGDSSIEDLGPSTKSGPGTATTVANNPSRGPGPGTTVDDHNPVTAAPTGTTAHNDDPDTTATSTPDPSVPATTDPSNKGKGGGGGGSSGGPPPTP